MLLGTSLDHFFYSHHYIRKYKVGQYKAVVDKMAFLASMLSLAVVTFCSSPLPLKILAPALNIPIFHGYL